MPTRWRARSPATWRATPGIGQSKGLWATGEDPDLLEAGNTQEGDTDNGAGPNGEVREADLGRTNK